MTRFTPLRYFKGEVRDKEMDFMSALNGEKVLNSHDYQTDRGTKF